MRNERFFLACMTGLLGALLAGCGEGRRIEIIYRRPAECPIGEDVRKIAVDGFGGQTERDRRWGRVVSDKLVSALTEAKLFVGPVAAIASPTTAGAHAVIYGGVQVDSRETQGSRTIASPWGPARIVGYVHRTGSATVSFTMGNPFTGRTLTSVTITKEYDSRRQAKSAVATAATGDGGDDLPSETEVLDGLIGECVAGFVACLSPHEVRFEVVLEKGDRKIVGRANRLAAAGDLEGALAIYVRALANGRDDDAAAFNAGVMNEKLGRLKAAARLYDHAFGIEGKRKYALAGRRVRDELARGGR